MYSGNPSSTTAVSFFSSKDVQYVKKRFGSDRASHVTAITSVLSLFDDLRPVFRDYGLLRVDGVAKAHSGGQLASTKCFSWEPTRCPLL